MGTYVSTGIRRRRRAVAALVAVPVLAVTAAVTPWLLGVAAGEDAGDPDDVGGRPSVRNLDPDLLEAVRLAARDARADGVRLSITSGWRSRAHQQRLYDDAVTEHGSEAEARRYVSTPDKSAHVTGDAVDIGPTDAAYWLVQHGSAYGLCQVFANEVWHFELATTPGGECPVPLPDSSYR